MQKKIFKFHIFALLYMVSFSHNICGVAAYMPEALREYIVWIYKFDNQKVSNEFKELYNMIVENRVIASDTLIRKVVHEAYNIVKKTNRVSNELRYNARTCLAEYIRNLDDRAILLTLNGNDARHIDVSYSSLARAFDIDSRSRDLIYLSNELTSAQNIELCGDIAYSIERKAAKVPSLIPPTSPSLVFNPNMLTSITSPNPTVIFGTGLSSPIINAWAMSPSSTIQLPINMQFSIPGSAKVEKGISLEMHFLIAKQDFVSGNVKIRVNALYAQNLAEITVDPMEITFSNESPSFFVYESSDANTLVHLAIDIPLEKSGIDKMDFALISLTRVQPDGDEYQGDIYLAAAAFRYRS